MRLQDIYSNDLTLSFFEVAQDSELVRQIQIRLKDLGLSVGAVDGLYGSATASALSTFIKAFGESDAQMTKRIAELLIEETSVPNIDPTLRIVSPEIVRAILNCPLSDAQTYLPAVLSALHERRILDKLTLIAAIATIGVETGGFRPIHEYGGHAYFTRMYEGRRDLGNTHRGDGARYHGRGFIQLTGRANYHTYGNKLSVDLEGNPDLALEPETAARVLALYFDERNVDDAARAENWYRVRLPVGGGYNGMQAFLHYVARAKARLL